MNDQTNPVDPGTNDAGTQPAANPGGAGPASSPGTDPGVVQTPANAAAQAHLQTARDSYDGGAPLESQVAWLVAQGHEAWNTPEKAAAAILAD